MKNVLKCGALLAAFIFLAALPAHADSGDTLSFDLSGPVSATWTMSENPTPMYVEDGTVFAVDVSDLVVNGIAQPDTICFFSLGDLGGLNSVIALPDLFGPQIYTGDEFNPTLLTGVFNFTTWDTGAQEVLTVTKAPEPTSLLLLCSGLVAIGLKRKRQEQPVS
jgi:hypothetical protein